jgi:hypothetical protein
MGAKSSKSEQTYEYTIDEKLMLYEHWFNLSLKLEMMLVDENLELSRLSEIYFLDQNFMEDLELRKKQIKNQSEVIKQLCLQCNYAYSTLNQIGVTLAN